MGRFHVLSTLSVDDHVLAALMTLTGSERSELEAMGRTIHAWLLLPYLLMSFIADDLADLLREHEAGIASARGPERPSLTHRACFIMQLCLGRTAKIEAREYWAPTAIVSVGRSPVGTGFISRDRPLDIVPLPACAPPTRHALQRSAFHC